MTPTPEAAEAVTKAANYAMYGGSGSALFFGLTANEFAAVAGVVIALIGLLVNIWFKSQHLKLARERLEASDDV